MVLFWTQNDSKCFKWCVLAKHVTGRNKYHISNNYYQHERKYDFSSLSFPTPLCDVKIFERNNQIVSINVYGIEKKFDHSSKSVSHIVFPLKVVEEEKADHLDLLFITDREDYHYVYINNYFRLIRAQKTSHKQSDIFCKRCFTSFDDRSLKY